MLNILMKSPKNQLAPVERKIQVSADLAGALDSIHAVIHVMQGRYATFVYKDKGRLVLPRQGPGPSKLFGALCDIFTLVEK